MSRRPASSSSQLVYSTDGGRMCPTCRRPVPQCACVVSSASPVGDGRVRVGRETKGRGGKAVTVVRGLPLTGEALTALAKRLRTACGAGGTLKDGTVEVQGDHVERVITVLADEGFAPRRSGG